MSYRVNVTDGLSANIRCRIFGLQAFRHVVCTLFPVRIFALYRRDAGVPLLREPVDDRDGVWMTMDGMRDETRLESRQIMHGGGPTEFWNPQHTCPIMKTRIAGF